MKAKGKAGSKHRSVTRRFSKTLIERQEPSTDMLEVKDLATAEWMLTDDENRCSIILGYTTPLRLRANIILC